MKGADGKRAWRELTGGWAEVQNKLHVEVDGLLGLLEHRGCQTSHRKIQSLASALDHARTADAYVYLGEPALAANALVLAAAWLDMALLEDNDYAAAVEKARAGERRSPLVEALATATERVRAFHPLLTHMSVPACVTRRSPQPSRAGAPAGAAPVGAIVGLVKPARRRRAT